MPEKPRRPTFDTDLKPVRVKNLKPVYVEDDEDQDSDQSTGSRGTNRKLTRQQQMSFGQESEAIATYQGIWDRIDDYVKRESLVTLLGRPRESQAADIFVAHYLRKLYTSEMRAFKEITDRSNWQRLRQAVADAFPENESRRLSATPPNRGRYRRFMDRHILGNRDELELMEEGCIDAAVKAAEHIDLLDPKTGSFNNPDKTRVGYGDTSFFKGRFNASREEAVDKETGEIVRRFDPDAHDHTGNNKKERGSPGFTVSLLGVRGEHPNERIPLVLTVKDPALAEGEDFIHNVERMIREHPAVKNGMLGVTYDMAVRSRHIDKLYRLGVIPFIKVSLTNRSEVPVITLHDQTFTLSDGTTRTQDVYLVDGTPSLDFVDGDGEFCFQPLRRIHTSRIKNDAKIDDELDAFRWYGLWEVPENPNLGRLVGATSRIRLDSTIEEIERQTGRRTNALRAFPPSDPGFHKVFGVREDAESLFANLKTPLVNRRIPCVGRDRFRLELLGSQGIAVIRALIAWHERTGGDVSAFFGQRCPLPRDGPHDCA